MIKLFMSIASFSWIVTLYLIHNEIFIFPYASPDRYISVGVYFLINLILGLLSLWQLNLLRYKSDDSLTIEKVYPIYNEYMPIYLAICVIAFELNNYVEITNSFTVYLIGIFIFILFHLSNISYLNPLWFLLNKRIYKIENDDSNYILLSDKIENIKHYGSQNEICKLIKIDEHTFIKLKG